MSRAPSPASRAVSDRNIAMAAQGSRGPGSGAMEITLTEPITRPLTEAEIAERAALKAAEDHSAAVQVCIDALAAGCEGAGCQDGHGGHVAGIVMALRILGLIDDPEAGTKDKYHYGQVRGNRK